MWYKKTLLGLLLILTGVIYSYVSSHPNIFIISGIFGFSALLITVSLENVFEKDPFKDYN